MGILKNSAIVTIFGDPIQLIFLFLISIILGLLIAWTYKKTYKGFSYSQSFSVSIVIITVITTFIILLIEDNVARAIGIFGAFSIIRFRTAVKDMRDIAFIFFTLAVGLAVGTKAIMIGLIGTLIICALIFTLSKINFGGLRKLEYILNFKVDAKKHSNEIFKLVMQKYFKNQALLNVDAKDKGHYLVFTFNVNLFDDNKLNDFIMEINNIEGVSDVHIVSSKNDLEF
jgi:uncharacterized membrane protein YhiD involved in acid resistance